MIYVCFIFPKGGKLITSGQVMHLSPGTRKNEDEKRMNAEHSSRGKLTGTFWVIIAYIAAIGAAAAAVILAGDQHPLVLAGIGDAAATLIIFLFSFLFNNSSFYDPYWSVAPPALGLFWLYRPEAETGDPIRQYLILGLVSLWAIRLTWNWYRGWTGLRHEDWRYVAYRKKGKLVYWLVSFTGFHFFPTLLVYVGCTGMYVALTSSTEMGWLDIVAGIVALGATLIQGLADNQLRDFRLSNPPKEAIRTDMENHFILTKDPLSPL